MDSSNVKNPNDKPTRRLSDHLKLEGRRKVHSLVDKVYHPYNLTAAWRKVKANKGSGGIDGVSLESFEEKVSENLERLFEELRDGTYRAVPVQRVHIPRAGDPGKTRPLGIPTIYDRVCQQAIVNRIEPVFEEVFDDSSFGYRPGRSQKDALTKIWRELNSGSEWIVDADLKNYFQTVDHQKLMTLVSQRISDGRVLRLLEQILRSGVVENKEYEPTTVGVPQGGGLSPILSNILLTPFDKEMRLRGYKLTRWADDWVITCNSRREAEAALAEAAKILQQLGVTLNQDKTRIAHIQQGFVFLGFKIKRGNGKFYLPAEKIKTKLNKRKLLVIPADKSVQKFRDTIRNLTRRRIPVSVQELVDRLNPVVRGWGNYFCRSNVKRLFNMLDRWIDRRIWSHHHKRWRNAGWKELPSARLTEEFGLVRLVYLIPGIRTAKARSRKAVCGKTARTV